MFQCLTSIYFSLAEPVKSPAALQCVQCVNTLIEKCSFSKLMCNATSAHICLPREGHERGEHGETKKRKSLLQEEEADHGRRRRKRGIIQERQQIPGGRSQRGPVMEMNEERQLGGLTSESVRRSDRGTMSFRETRLTAKAKRTVTKRGAASEPRAALIKHLHHTVSETQGSHQGVGVGAVHWARHGSTPVDITQIHQKPKMPAA